MAPKSKGGNKKSTSRITTNKDSFFKTFRDSHPSTSHLTSADLTIGELYHAYGLASTSSAPASAPISNSLIRCSSKWTGEAATASGSTDLVDAKKKNEVKSKSPEVEEDSNVIVLDSSTSDDDYKSGKSSSDEKGKGKAKATYGKGGAGGKKTAAGPAVPVCSKENCVLNPACLNWLGQDVWEDSEKALKLVAKAVGLGSDPSNDRDSDLPVGLKNLGATCYANSFLQVWYQDLTFRSGVYACLPPASGAVDTSPLYQLQVLFAFLQTSGQAVYDPSPLIHSLKLDTKEQQDATEFAKLFMSLLENEFKKQGKRRAAEEADYGNEAEQPRRVERLIQEQFEGQITYGTKCETCNTKSERHSSFLELEISLVKNCKLEDRIKQSLGDEYLNGNNQYQCEACAEKMRDAVRYTCLDVLPPVLHFSILRFVFSSTDFTRSKSQHAISYPLHLDMSKYLKGAHHPEGLWYDLKGVLMHKGQSAHHGHYVAQVHDALKNKWYLFDDEVVSEIDDLNAPDKYDEEAELVEKKSSKIKPKSKNGTGFTRDEKGDVLPRSKDAYMLVYIRRSTQPSHLEEPVPPPLALSHVEDLDRKHGEVVEQYMAQKQALLADFEERREKKRGVYKVLDAIEEDEDSYLVDKAELRRWIEHGLKPETKLETKGDVTPSDEVIAVVDGSLEAIDKHEASNESIEDIEMTTCPETPGEEREDPSVKVDDAPPLEADRSSSEKKEGDEDIGSDILIVEKEPFDPVCLKSNAVLCPHGSLAPAKMEHVKIIGSLAVIALSELGVRLEPELLTRSSLCRECVWAQIDDHVYFTEHEDHCKQFDSLAKDWATGEGAFVSKAWLAAWKKISPKSRVGAPDSGDWKNDIRCLHGALNPDEKKRKLLTPAATSFLRSIFDEWNPLFDGADECAKCRKQLSKSDEEEQKMKALINSEKAVLKYDNQTRLTANQLFVGNDEVKFVVPIEFGREWSKWCKAKSSKVPRPSDIDNNKLQCRHGRLLLDLNSEIYAPEKIDLVSETEWKMLQKSYNAGPQIKVYREESRLVSSPATCADCLKEERKNFSSAEILIRILTDSDLDKNGKPNVDLSLSPETQVVPLQDPRASRSSQRIRTAPVMKARKALKKLEMKKGDSIKDIKIRIQDKLDTPTIYQRLFFEGRELDSDESVEDVGLSGGSTLDLYQITVDDSDVDFKNLVDVAPSTSGRKRKADREGFGGTGLSGGWEAGDEPEEQVASGSGSSSRSLSNGDELDASIDFKRLRRSSVQSMDVNLPCPTCTLLQSPENDDCEVCGNPMTS